MVSITSEVVLSETRAGYKRFRPFRVSHLSAKMLSIRARFGSFFRKKSCRHRPWSPTETMIRSRQLSQSVVQSQVQSSTCGRIGLFFFLMWTFSEDILAREMRSRMARVTPSPQIDGMVEIREEVVTVLCCWLRRCSTFETQLRSPTALPRSEAPRFLSLLNAAQERADL